MNDEGKVAVQLTKENGTKILIVDDEKEVRDLIKEILTIDNFKVIEAGTGKQALKLINKENPDLILLDVLMPGSLNGIEVCRQLKSDFNTRTIPIFLLTVMPINKKTCKDITADGFFTKPFSPIKLINRIYDVLDRN